MGEWKTGWACASCGYARPDSLGAPRNVYPVCPACGEMDFRFQVAVKNEGSWLRPRWVAKPAPKEDE